MSGVLMLIAARARRRPGRWLPIGLGLTLTAAFVGVVLAQGTIAGTQAARELIAGASPLARTVRVSWQGPLTPSARREAIATFGRLGLGPPTQVILLNPVRLNGELVRPAAISPLAPWASGPAVPACRENTCSMLLAGGSVGRRPLIAADVRLSTAGTAELHSEVPLAFLPAAGEPPLLLTGDVAGLDAIAGLSGVYRSHDWVAVLGARLDSWQLAGVEARLRGAEAGLLAQSTQFSFDGPFAALDSARAAARSAPRELLVIGGSAAAALLLFLVLAAGGLRRDQAQEVARLRAAGSSSTQCVALVGGEAAWLCAAAWLTGAALAVAISALLAGTSGVPVSGVLAHSLLTPTGGLLLLGGWLATTVVLALLLSVTDRRVADVLAVSAVAALALSMLRGAGAAGTFALVLAPLSCLAAGVIVFRIGVALLPRGERAMRRGPVLPHLAAIGLGRAPGVPALLIAFIALTTGLGGFALAYRATLARGSQDEAADQVPLDALVAPTPGFVRPFQLASRAQWDRLAGGPVFPVRRTEATFLSGAGTVTVPALGVPAGALALLHGWRDSDGSAPLASLAHRLVPPGPARTAGPELPADARALSLRVRSPELEVDVTAVLRRRGADAAVSPVDVDLGTTGAGRALLRARLPRGDWELSALELTEPTGLQVTNEHQNGENAGAATQASVPVTLGPATVIGPGGQRQSVSLAAWRSVGAAEPPTVSGPSSAGTLPLMFSETGAPGVLRPVQPSDGRPVPVLVDARTAAAASASGGLGLTVDGLAVPAQVAGVLARFPTVSPGGAGFVIADETTLAAALEAQMPGQGAADELWIASPHPGRLRAALSQAPLAQLNTTFRADVVHGLASAPVSRAVFETLGAAAALAGVLALVGLVVAVLGSLRDPRVEDDLAAQGAGPRWLRTELRLRLALTGLAGVAAGLAVVVLLSQLTLPTVRAVDAAAAPPWPPLVAVLPLGALVGWALLMLLALATTGGAVTRRTVRHG